MKKVEHESLEAVYTHTQGALNKSKGITLVALVITIIVLLILAGITMTLVMGENGLIARAQEAGKNYTDAENKESADLANLDNAMGEYISTDRENYTITRKLIAENVSFEGNPTKKYNISEITDKYKELTDENFAYTTEFYASFATSGEGVFHLTLSYNRETGILTVNSTGLSQPGLYYAFFSNVKLYVYY